MSVLLAACLLALPAPPPVQVLDLGATAAGVAVMWAQVDVGGITELSASAGIRLQILDQRYLPMTARRVAAALRELFSARRVGTARVIRATEVGGEPRQGFAELEWTRAAAGGQSPERFIVFVGFTLEEVGWRISEIRVLQ